MTVGGDDIKLISRACRSIKDVSTLVDLKLVRDGSCAIGCGILLFNDI